MKDIKTFLEAKVMTINQDPEKRRKIEKWINGYRAKVICLKTETESYHLVFKKDRVTLRPGDYSSCEFTYIGPKDVLLEILQGKKSAGSTGMAGAIKGWGSLNEAQQFERLLG
jgi:putative sterol carrier protein